MKPLLPFYWQHPFRLYQCHTHSHLQLTMKYQAQIYIHHHTIGQDKENNLNNQSEVLASFEDNQVALVRLIILLLIFLLFNLINKLALGYQISIHLFQFHSLHYFLIFDYPFTDPQFFQILVSFLLNLSYQVIFFLQIFLHIIFDFILIIQLILYFLKIMI